MGEPDWNKTLDRISPQQWEIYRALDSLEGIGSKRMDMLFGKLASLVMAAQGVSYSMDDFLFDVESQEKRRTPQKFAATSKPTRKSTEDALKLLAQQREG